MRKIRTIPIDYTFVLSLPCAHPIHSIFIILALYFTHRYVLALHALKYAREQSECNNLTTVLILHKLRSRKAWEVTLLAETL